MGVRIPPLRSIISLTFTHMEIKIYVSSGTVTNVRARFEINGSITGELLMSRADFTKFCDLLYHDGYSITGESPRTLKA